MQHHLQPLVSLCLLVFLQHWLSGIQQLVGHCSQGIHELLLVTEITVCLGLYLVSERYHQIHGTLAITPLIRRATHHQDDAVLIYTGSIAQFFIPDTSCINVFDTVNHILGFR